MLTFGIFNHDVFNHDVFNHDVFNHDVFNRDDPQRQKANASVSSKIVIIDSCSVPTSNCHRQLRVRPRGVEIDPLSMEEPTLELLLVHLAATQTDVFI